MVDDRLTERELEVLRRGDLVLHGRTMQEVGPFCPRRWRNDPLYRRRLAQRLRLDRIRAQFHELMDDASPSPQRTRAAQRLLVRGHREGEKLIALLAAERRAAASGKSQLRQRPPAIRRVRRTRAPRRPRRPRRVARRCGDSGDSSDGGEPPARSAVLCAGGGR